MANINLYSTKTMIAAITSMPPVSTFLRDTFFPVANDETFVTEEVWFDYKKGKRKMAPFVAPRVGGITMDRQGFRTDKYSAPRIAPQRILTIDDIVKRGMGENLFSQRTPAQRQQELLAKDLIELDEMITRREEWMARELLVNGKITMKGFIDTQGSKFVEDVVDFGFTNKVALAGEAKWDQATSKKYENLKEWRLSVIQKTGQAPNMVIMAQDVLALFLGDAVIQKKMDTRNMNFGEINPVVKDPALTYIGRLTELGLELYTYDEWFIDDDDVEKSIIPSKTLIMAKKNIGKFCYGAVTQMENDNFITYEGKRIPKQWADNQNEQKMIRISSRPVPQPFDIDSWYVAQVY
jgi:hypothetical protein